MLLGVMLIVAALPSTAEATYPGENGRILFTQWAQDDGRINLRIFSVRANGTGMRALTPRSQTSYCATGSPDGERIAFAASGPEIDAGIWVMDADGSDSHLLVAGFTGCLTWSPHGRRIAYDIHSGIWVINADGASPPERILAIRGARAPAWSPDGHRIAFTLDRRGKFSDIALVHPDGSQPHTKVTDTARGVEDFPEWHPSGDRLFFVLQSGSGPDLFRFARRPFEQVRPAFPDFEHEPV